MQLSPEILETIVLRAVQRRGQSGFRNPSQQRLWMALARAFVEAGEDLGYHLEHLLPDACPACGGETRTATWYGDGVEKPFVYCVAHPCGWSGL